jgi:CheY-like chemotaxis protein
MNDKAVNILLIEDDKIDVMNVKRAFKKNNISNPLFVAENGEEALQKLRGELGYEKIDPLPRIILLDLNMPRMGGIEFLKALRADEKLKDISVFVMTTSNEDNDKVEAFRLNVAGYILKPLSMVSFVEAVSTLHSYWMLCEYPDSN